MFWCFILFQGHSITTISKYYSLSEGMLLIMLSCSFPKMGVELYLAWSKTRAGYNMAGRRRHFELTFTEHVPRNFMQWFCNTDKHVLVFQLLIFILIFWCFVMYQDCSKTTFQSYSSRKTDYHKMPWPFTRTWLFILKVCWFILFGSHCTLFVSFLFNNFPTQSPVSNNWFLAI